MRSARTANAHVEMDSVQTERNVWMLMNARLKFVDQMQSVEILLEAIVVIVNLDLLGHRL